MNDRVSLHGLSIDRDLFALINDQALPHIGIAHESFWSGFSDLISELTPKNRALLARREELETLINEWHAERRGIPHDPKSYRAFLSDIGYLAPEGPDFSVSTQGIDPEITAIPGPQLVVPVNNARYAINATNARWGSLYDALYELFGTDKIDKKIESGEIEIAPLAFMRGRTLKNCFAILDEAQNATETQIKMFLTRIGENSKLVVNGDPSQVDLINKRDSGLTKSKKILKDLDEIKIIEFDHRDVVRHPLVSKIIKAYQNKSIDDKN